MLEKWQVERFKEKAVDPCVEFFVWIVQTLFHEAYFFSRAGFRYSYRRHYNCYTNKCDEIKVWILYDVFEHF